MNVAAIFVLLALALFAGYYALAKDLIADRMIAETDSEVTTPLLSAPASTAAPEAPAAPLILSPAPAEAPAALPDAPPVAIVAQVVEIVETQQNSIV
jgi:hypothetical protein